ncbi:oligogalacturonate lyase family protein [Niabella drilacis]|uniref:Oligogalacturonide lyase n=1 Tax=Niabella drilacis (strain DSM 25811 / CCM 8410 / CCUG 62505 / LMG 26954 / E90) TaxID=1285928 RepID=A0A1G6IYG4_NIADE|nr:oligogalacturonate lyase family protein [Niabella drilacis]SDC10816.1 oligogalacturonide lyase [Niabella drilacis]
MKKIFFAGLLLGGIAGHTQPVLKTGPDMPREWIDADTHHKVIRLTNNDRSNLSFYFHNDPFAGSKMVYYSTEKIPTAAAKQETYNSNTRDRQLYLLDLNTLQSERLTNHTSPMQGEIVCPRLNKAFFQVKDSVFAVDLSTKKESLIYIFPADFKATVTTINADGTLLAGARYSDAEKELFRKYPGKGSYFTIIYEAKLPRTLFTIDIRSGRLNKIFTDSAWLNHIQFSPADPRLLMFCHEGPWHKVDRIWTINVITKTVKLVHKRTMPMEIAGHEWFSKDGKTIWFDLQQPRGVTFFVGGTDLATGTTTKYRLQRNEWSVHYTTSPDGKLFAGDGGAPGAVAKAPDGQWIYLFTPENGIFKAEKLVNMQQHRYQLEPNIHFTPDQRYILFRANFEGKENIYAVAIKPTRS